MFYRKNEQQSIHHHAAFDNQEASKEEMEEEIDQLLLHNLRETYNPHSVHRITSRRTSREILNPLENRKNVSVCSMLFNAHGRHHPNNLSDLIYKPIAGRLSNCYLDSQFKLSGLDSTNNNDYQKVT